MKFIKCFKIKFPSYDENGKKLKKGKMNRIFRDSLIDMMNDNSLEMKFNIIENLSSDLSDKIDKDIIDSIKGN